MFLYSVTQMTIFVLCLCTFFFCMSAIAHFSSECTHRNFPIHNTNILPWPHNQRWSDTAHLSCAPREIWHNCGNLAQTWNRTGLYLISHNARYSQCLNLKRECRQSVLIAFRHRLLFGPLQRALRVLHSARQKEKLWFSATSFDEEVKMILRDKDLK